jgi:hypothetical protein
MSTAPIGEELYAKAEFSDIPHGRVQHIAPAEYTGENEPTPAGSSRLMGGDFMSDLLDAQQRLITAHYQFLYDENLKALARAQLNVLDVHNKLLDRLGVFG